MWNDLRYSGRLLLRNPSFAVTSIVTLALAIGINLSVYSITQSVILTPLPYAEPAQLVAIWDTNLAEGKAHERVTPPNFVDYRGLSGVFEDTAAWWRFDVNLTDDIEDAARVSTAECTGNFFRILGVTPRLGVGFNAGEMYSPSLSATISHQLWSDRYGGDPDIIGKVVSLGGNDYTIVGVMERGFSFPSPDIDVWQHQSWPWSARSRFARFMEAIGRLQDGVTIDDAQVELTALSQRLEREHPSSNANWRGVLAPLHTEIIGEYGPALRILMIASGVLLLLASINVANLFLVRIHERGSEIAVRAAVGAAPRRILRLAISEALIVSGSATLLGVALSTALLRALVATGAVGIPRLDEVAFDTNSLFFALAVMLVTALFLGTLPATRLLRPDFRNLLQATVGSAVRSRHRKLLIAAEIALALALITAAGLLTRSMERLHRQDIGFVPEGVATVTVELPLTLYPEWQKVLQTFSLLFDELGEHPAITSAGGAGFLPYSPAWMVPYFLPEQSGQEMQRAQYVTITEGYFETLGATVLAGRLFTDRDNSDSPNAVIVNRQLAQQSWGSAAAAIGQVIRVGTLGFGPLGKAFTENRMFEVVGVVSDVRNNGLVNPADASVFFSDRQFTYRTLHVVLRGEGTSVQLAAVVQDVLSRIDAALPVGNVRTLTELTRSETERQQLLTTLVTVFAAAAALLAGIGVYGLLAYLVSNRRQELALRLSLGASSSDLRRGILVEGFQIAVYGVLMGVVLAFIAGRSLGSMLFEVSSRDPVIYSLAIAAVFILGLLASAGPAFSTRHVLPREITNALAR